MARINLVPLLISFGVKANGQADYPDLNQVSSAIRKGMGWSVYLDACGIGAHYDKVSNLGTGADKGTMGVCVPRDFADAALALFPSQITEINEVAWKAFYEDRSHVNESDDINSPEVLSSLASKATLGIALSPDDILALDRNSKKPGVVKNESRRWADYKAARKITVRVESR